MAKMILLVEDSVTMQKVVEMTFSAEDFDLTVVSNGEEALERIRNDEVGYRENARPLQPDIVIMDLSLEGMSGYDVCKSVKQVSRMPVLLLHGSASTYNEAKAQAAGADGDIAKPFETQALIDKVKALTAEGVRPVEVDTSALEEPQVEEPPPRPKRRTMPPPLPTRPKRATKGPPPPPPPTRRPRTTPPPPPRPARKMPVQEAPPPVMAAPPPIMEAPTVAVGAPPMGPEPQEIVIEAELPPMQTSEPLPSFETTTQDRIAAPPLEVSVPRDAPADTVTLKGFSAPDLPEPPAGLGVPVAPPVASVKTTPTVDTAAYEAIAKLSQEVIERVVWEVVPQLAEKIIREELDRLVEKPRGK